MRKKDLHSLRKANRRLVLGLLAEGAPLSRAEIAERTGLSASTVSTIMSDLLTEGLVHDTGDTESTGGRGRRLLGINPACGVMAIAEIQRQRTTVCFHDMGLGRLGARTLEVPIKPGAGDQLLQAICECVSAFAHCAPAPGGLAGIGLLFDDQAIASDVTVLYSTGFDEASISLRQALITRFKVPVVEESAQACSARELVAALHGAGVRVGVTSGGFTALVAPLAEELGLDFFNANELEIRDKALTGRVIGTVVDRDQKARDLTRFATTAQVPLEHAVAVGDGANDLGMLAAAGLGVAYRAKPVTAARADAVINFPRLDAVTALALP